LPNCDKVRLIDDVLRSWKNQSIIVPGGNHSRKSASWPDGRIERLATAHLSISQSMIASPLQCVVRRGGAELFGKKVLILVVVTDPIPKEGVVFEDGEGSIARANPN
jgi:hypothetical protein